MPLSYVLFQQNYTPLYIIADTRWNIDHKDDFQKRKWLPNYTYSGNNYRTDFDGQMIEVWGPCVVYVDKHDMKKKSNFFHLSFTIRNVMSGANILIWPFPDSDATSFSPHS